MRQFITPVLLPHYLRAAFKHNSSELILQIFTFVQCTDVVGDAGFQTSKRYRAKGENVAYNSETTS